MWPWEHLAIGYLLYSLGGRALGRGPPSGGATVALAVATQIPDLVDKPLSWGLGWFPSGYALGHSALVALPLTLHLLLVARRRGRTRLVAGGLVGYWAHLAADVLNPVRSGGRPRFGRVLWPLSDHAPYDSDLGLGRGLLYLDRFVENLLTMDPLSVALVVALPLATLALWVVDGAPGVGLAVRTAGRARRRWW